MCGGHVARMGETANVALTEFQFENQKQRLRKPLNISSEAVKLNFNRKLIISLNIN
jgi:hypothetical protein